VIKIKISIITDCTINILISYKDERRKANVGKYVDRVQANLRKDEFYEKQNFFSATCVFSKEYSQICG